MQPEQVASPERCRAKRNKNREAGRKGKEMRQIERRCEVKEGRTWKTSWRTEDPAEIYKELAHELMNCKIFHYPSYKRMEQRSNYDGTRTVTFYHDNGVKSVYIIEAR